MSNLYNKPPKEPIYAAVFTNQRSKVDETGYQRMATAMVALAEKQLGFLGIESIRDDKGFGITVSYWQTLDDIKAWKENTAHKKAQEEGQKIWYESYTTRIVEVEHIYGFLT